MQIQKVIQKSYPPIAKILHSQRFCLSSQLQNWVQIHEGKSSVSCINVKPIYSYEKPRLTHCTDISQNQLEFIFQGNRELYLVNCFLQEFSENTQFFGSDKSISQIATKTIKENKQLVNVDIDGRINIWNCEKIQNSQIKLETSLQTSYRPWQPANTSDHETNLSFHENSIMYPGKFQLYSYNVEQNCLNSFINLQNERELKISSYIPLKNNNFGLHYCETCISLVDWRTKNMAYRKQTNLCRKVCQYGDKYGILFADFENLKEIDLRMPSTERTIIDEENPQNAFAIRDFEIGDEILLVSSLSSPKLFVYC